MPPSNPRRSPAAADRQRDAERTRARILEAASAEFAAHGYAGARVSAIAARAGVNQQLISYYFGGKEGVYGAVSQRWWERRSELIPAGTAFPEQVRRYVLEAIRDPDGPRLLAWNGLQYGRADVGPDGARPAAEFRAGVAELRALQADGAMPADVDPEILLVILMAAAMAPTTLPQVIAGVTGHDPRSPEFIERFADQLATFVAGLGGRGSAGPV